MLHQVNGMNRCNSCGLDFRFLCALAIDLHVETCRPSSPMSNKCAPEPPHAATALEEIVDLTSPCEQSLIRTDSKLPDDCQETSAININGGSVLNFDSTKCELSAASICRSSFHIQYEVRFCAEDDSQKEKSPGGCLWSRLESRLISRNQSQPNTDSRSALDLDKSTNMVAASFRGSIDFEDVPNSTTTQASNLAEQSWKVEKRAPLQPLESSLGNIPRPNQLYVQKRPRNIVASNVECSVGCTRVVSRVVSQMPNYAGMEVDQLKTLLQAYGVRSGQKRYMVEKLTEIWLRLQSESSTSSQDPETSMKAQAEAERVEFKKRQRSAQQEERDKRTLVAAVETLRSHVVLYERILLMESLSLDEVSEALAEEGVRISMRLLSHLLNELGVPYTHGPPRRNKLPHATDDR